MEQKYIIDIVDGYPELANLIIRTQDFLLNEPHYIHEIVTNQILSVHLSLSQINKIIQFG